MEPVYCPNGHPNRPGTRICIVCRALLESSAPVETPRKPAAERPPAPQNVAPPPPRSPEEEVPAPAVQPSPVRRSRAWLWLLLMLLVAALAIVALRSLLFPATEAGGEAPTPALPAEAVVAGTTAAVGSDNATTSVPPLATNTVIPATTTAPPETPTDSPTTVSTITPLATIVGVVITPTFAFGPDANFIQNGDFADDWVNGWTRSASSRPIAEVIEMRSEADGGDALHLEKTGPDSLQLAQRVVLTFPAEGLVFRTRVQMTGTTQDAAEGRAALVLRYEDSAGTPLGASVWLDGSADETGLWGVEPLPAAGPTLAVHYLDDGWQAIELALGQELLEELPDVDPVAVRQITVIMALLGEESCAPADCMASLTVTNLSLTAEGP